MKLLFVQNCISPHQMPYIEALAECPEVEQVAVISPRVTYVDRAAMGWTVPASSAAKLTVRIAPERKQVESLMASADIALFSGITAFPELREWLDLSMRYPLRRGCITEAPLTYNFSESRWGMGKPLWLHKIRFFLKDFRYARHFDWVFAIGPDAIRYYQSLGLSWQIVPFIYCTKSEGCVEASAIDETMPMQVLYVGSLSPRKNVALLLEALSKIRSPYQLAVIGDGQERPSLEVYAQRQHLSVRFLGSLPMQQCRQAMRSHDVLVLPSKHDGWGAVVNEAMQEGAWVLCSDRCGARQLIDDSGYGMVFSSDDAGELAEALEKAGQGLAEVRRLRSERQQWADEHLSPQAVAQRMLAALKG